MNVPNVQVGKIILAIIIFSVLAIAVMVNIGFWVINKAFNVCTTIDSGLKYLH